MIRSMTAFAKGDRSDRDVSMSVQVSGYNSRYLDISIKLPFGYESLEDKIRGLISKKITRGRIEVRIKIVNNSEEGAGIKVNGPQAIAVHNALKELKDILDIPQEISLEMIASHGQVLVHDETPLNIEKIWLLLEPLILGIVTELIKMKEKEGVFIAGDFLSRLDCIEEFLSQIENESSDLPAIYQKRLEDRIFAMTKGVVSIDESRLAQEAAFLADRSDISEEITRSKSHVEQFRTIMNSKEPAGKKLNFLLQELNREFNTMGSKAGNAQLSHIIVSVKSELEKIREQVQNIE